MPSPIKHQGVPVIKTLVLVLVLTLAACKTPPPIASGKCLVDVYDKDVASRQTCQYQGYTWRCVSDQCTRGGEVGERPPAIPMDGGAP